LRSFITVLEIMALSLFTSTLLRLESSSRLYIKFSTKEEQELRDRRNKAYEVCDTEKELIMQYFKVVASEKGNFYTNADILEVLTDGVNIKIKLNAWIIGKSMTQLGFLKEIRKINGHTTRGYIAQKNPSKSYVSLDDKKEESNLFDEKNDEKQRIIKF